VVYIEALAVLGHLRLGRRDHVAALVEPYLSGAKDSLEKPTASHYSGHLLFAEYARNTGDPRATALVAKAAALAGENPLDNEMSDSVFMVCPILAAASQFEEAGVHFARMEKMCRRTD